MVETEPGALGAMVQLDSTCTAPPSDVTRRFSSRTAVGAELPGPYPSLMSARTAAAVGRSLMQRYKLNFKANVQKPGFSLHRLKGVN
jgi:hypothetical protein